MRHETLLLAGLAVAAAVALALGGAVERANAAFPGTNGKIAYRCQPNLDLEICVMSSDGSGQENLTQNAAMDTHPAWSPDGHKIAFTTDRDDNDEVYVMNADGSRPRNLTQSPFGDLDPAWSPDGSQIAFVSNRDGNLEIYVMNADGSSQTRVTTDPGEDRAPAWSPDGTQIAFMSDRRNGFSFDIYKMNADGSALTQLATIAGNPTWSPEGSRIAFDHSPEPFSVEIYVMNADGTDRRNLTQAPGLDVRPSWSPDGSAIAFDSNRNGPFEGSYDIYVVQADGSATTRLTVSGWNFSPDWQTFPTTPPDDDNDGIPDDEDVEGIQEAVDALPTGAFKSGGLANAMNSLLDEVEALIASGDTATAIRKLENLRRHLDGCGSSADTNDWIVDCDHQLEIRGLIDTLISNLSS